jgi:AraC-like DNA-binding protein
LLDVTRLARDAGLSRPTVMHYLEVAETTLTVHLVRPYHAGKAREWTHQPKAYTFDTGFICHARGWDHLRPEDCGGLWEHLVLDTLLSVEDPANVRFWRDHQQREVDFVVSRARDVVDAYECKWSALQPDTRNLRAFRAAYPEGRNFVVVPQLAEPTPLRRDGLRVAGGMAIGCGQAWWVHGFTLSVITHAVEVRVGRSGPERGDHRRRAAAPSAGPGDRWRRRNSNVPTPWIVCGPLKNSTSVRSPIPSLT